MSDCAGNKDCCDCCHYGGCDDSALVANRDHWREQSRYWHRERNRFKAKLEMESEKYSILGADFCEIEKERDMLKSQLAVAREALEYVVGSGESYERVQEFAENALAKLSEAKQSSGDVAGDAGGKK